MNLRIAEIEKLAERAREQRAIFRANVGKDADARYTAAQIYDTHAREMAVAIVALKPGYLAAMAEVAEAATEVRQKRRDADYAMNKVRTDEDQEAAMLMSEDADKAEAALDAALARLRELEPGKEGNG